MRIVSHEGKGALTHTCFASFTPVSFFHTCPLSFSSLLLPLSCLTSYNIQIHDRLQLSHVPPNERTLRILLFSCRSRSPSRPTVSRGWSVRWLPLCMAQNGLLWCPEETIKWLTCFKATGRSAGFVMNKCARLFGSTHGGTSGSRFAQLPLLMSEQAGDFTQMTMCLYDKLWIVPHWCCAVCVCARSCMEPLGLSHCKCYCLIMRSRSRQTPHSLW